MTEESTASGTSGGFSDRVLIYFLAQVVTAGLGIFNGLFLAWLIGPSQKGDYYLLTLLTTTLMVVCQFGLPQAFGFFAAKDQTRGLVGRTIVLTLLVAAPVLALMFLALPALSDGLFVGIDQWLIVVPLIAFPFLLNATFTTGIVVGRQAARWLASVNVIVSLVTTPTIVVLVGVLDLGLGGAILAYALTVAILWIGFLIGSRRVIASVPGAGTVSYGGLLRYGLPFYPGSITQFFSNRADVFLVALLLVDPSAPLGYYSMAVGLAELVFFFPNAVSTFYFPHVAGSSRADADRQVPMVSRVTLLLTAIVGLAALPAATVAILVVLPAFEPSLAALYVLLPGVVALSLGKVLSGYLAGLGRTGLTSIVSVSAFTLNIVLNLILIPRFGIVGAAASSLLSYSGSSLAYSVIVARLSGARWTDFWIPRGEDIRFAVATTRSLVQRIARSLRQARALPDSEA